MDRELKRTLSSGDISAAEEIHKYIKVQQDGLKDQIPILKRDVTKSSMILPEQYNENTLKLCVDLIHLNGFESSGVLNWSTACRMLLPLAVEDDGNSLMHSLSVYMFGVHDRRLLLRQLLYQRLFMDGSKGQLKQRWVLKNSTTSNLTWNNVVEMASEKKLTHLTAIHVFTMANILARPIIVLCDDELMNKKGGIYLPLLRKPQECEKSPIILGYKNGHFLPLVSSENLDIPLCNLRPSPDALHCIPLVNVSNNELAVAFLLPKEEFESKQFVNAYLDVVSVIDNHKGLGMIPAAMLKFKAPPAHSIQLMWALDQSAIRMYSQSNVAKDETTYTDLLELDDANQNYQSLNLCANNRSGCLNNASSNNHHNLCSDCYNKFLSDDTYLVPVNEKVEKCNESSCQNVGTPGLNGKCKACFSLYGHDASYSRLDGLRESANNILNNSNTDQKVAGSHYDRLDIETFMKNRPLPIPPDANISNDVNRTVGDSGRHAANGNVGDAGTGSLLGAAAAPVSNISPADSVKKKLVCAIAGCTNSIGTDGKHCNTCSPAVFDDTNKRGCVMKGCTNTAEFNDNWLCMVCFQSQKHVVRESKVLDRSDLNSREGGAFDVRSLAHDLPPVRIPDNFTVQGNSNAQFSNQQQMGYPATSNISAIAHGIPNIPRIPTPNIPDVVAMSPNTQVPGNMTQQPFKPPMTYGGFEGFDKIGAAQRGSLHWQKGAVNEPHYQRKCLHCDNHSNPAKGGLCNECYRQKEEGAKNVLPEPEAMKCINDGCRGAGMERFNFLCELCYQKQIDALKNDAQRKTSEKVVSPNRLYSVDNPQMIQGGAPNSYNPNVFEQPRFPHGNIGGSFHGRNMDIRQGNPVAVNTTTMNAFSTATHPYGPNVNPAYNIATSPDNGGIPYPFNMNTNHLAYQQPGPPLNPVTSNNTPIYQNTAFPPNLSVQNTIGANVNQPPLGFQNIIGANVNQPPLGVQNNIGANVNHPAYPNPVPPNPVARQNCKGLSCEFFGSEEYGGYCSSCFLNITKTEAVKRNSMHTFAPPDANAVPPVPNAAMSPRCKGYQCPNFGSNERMGYCTLCAQFLAAERQNIPYNYN